MKIIMLVFLLILLGGCTIHQNVEPSSYNGMSELCVVEDMYVKESFRSALDESLTDKNIMSSVVSDVDKAFVQCNWTLEYQAEWSWDFVTYMTYAKIVLYEKNTVDGVARYDARRASGSWSKWVNTKAKVKELLDELLPL